MYLVNFDDNWADEIDIHESAIITEDEYQALRKYLKIDEVKAYEEKYGDDVDIADEYVEFEKSLDSFYKAIYVGTNEEIEYCGLSGMQALWEAFEFFPITEDEAAAVRKFNLVGYSHIIEGLIEDATEGSDE